MEGGCNLQRDALEHDVKNLYQLGDTTCLEYKVALLPAFNIFLQESHCVDKFHVWYNRLLERIYGMYQDCTVCNRILLTPSSPTEENE